LVAGFEPLDILAALVKLLEMIRDSEYGAANAYPRCVTREGNRRAQASLWRVFEAVDGPWRGIGVIPRGNLQLTRGMAGWTPAARYSASTCLASRRRYARSSSRRCLCGKDSPWWGWSSVGLTHFSCRECRHPSRPVGSVHGAQ